MTNRKLAFVCIYVVGLGGGGGFGEQKFDYIIASKSPRSTLTSLIRGQLSDKNENKHADIFFFS